MFEATPEYTPIALSGQAGVIAQHWLLAQMGIPTKLEELIAHASTHDLYRPDRGTPPEDISKLLQLYTHRFRCVANATLTQLGDCLLPGNRVLIAAARASLPQNSDLGRRVQIAFAWDQAAYLAFPVLIESHVPHTTVALIDPIQNRPFARVPARLLFEMLPNQRFSFVWVAQEERYDALIPTPGAASTWEHEPIQVASPAIINTEYLLPDFHADPAPLPPVGTHHSDVGTHHSDVGTLEMESEELLD